MIHLWHIAIQLPVYTYYISSYNESTLISDNSIHEVIIDYLISYIASQNEFHEIYAAILLNYDMAAVCTGKYTVLYIETRYMYVGIAT